MPRASRADKDLDSSTEILLAEHERLSALFLYNSDLGEKRITAYLTLVSLGVGGMLGLSQLNTDQTTVLELSAGILTGIFLLGFITFFRLIERRIRNTEYLRAINRIHAYFANNDPEVGTYFYWPHADDVPSFKGGLSDFTALREIIAIMNAVFFGVAFVLLGHIFQPEPRSVVSWLVLLGIVLGLGILALQIAIETVVLRKQEEIGNASVRFPSSASVKK